MGDEFSFKGSAMQNQSLEPWWNTFGNWHSWFVHCDRIIIDHNCRPVSQTPSCLLVTHLSIQNGYNMWWCKERSYFMIQTSIRVKCRQSSNLCRQPNKGKTFSSKLPEWHLHPFGLYPSNYLSSSRRIQSCSSQTSFLQSFWGGATKEAAHSRDAEASDS